LENYQNLDYFNSNPLRLKIYLLYFKAQKDIKFNESSFKNVIEEFNSIFNKIKSSREDYL